MYYLVFKIILVWIKNTMSQKILVVFGTRPEVIKLAPVILEMKRHPENFDVILCSTGQHKELLDLALEDFDLVPDIYLQIMKQGQSLSNLTSNLINTLSKVIDQYSPDILLVQGDTTTVMAASLVAFYKGIRIGHIEAGLRSWNLHSPFPEELNRRLVSLITDYHFTPTKEATANLIEEKVDGRKIFETGNTIIDAIGYIKNYGKHDPLPANLQSMFDRFKKVILVTAHRRESFGESFVAICNALKSIASENKDVGLVFPVHMNPNVVTPVHKILGNVPGILLTEPLSYKTMISLMQRCYFVLTDSGGIQEEALALSIPVLVMRDTTEREEGIRAGGSILVGTDYSNILFAANELLENEGKHGIMSKAVNPYGDGTAARKIVSVLIGKS